MHHGDLDRDHADGVAVGWCRGDGLVPDRARAARAVHDDDRLLELAFQEAADDARGRVGAAAGAPRHDELNLPLRILRERAERHHEQRR
jgi:hypothetical protein